MAEESCSRREKETKTNITGENGTGQADPSVRGRSHASRRGGSCPRSRHHPGGRPLTARRPRPGCKFLLCLLRGLFWKKPGSVQGVWTPGPVTPCRSPSPRVKQQRAEKYPGGCSSIGAGARQWAKTPSGTAPPHPGEPLDDFRFLVVF